MAAQLIGADIEMRTGEVSDRARFRDAIVDRIPGTSQEESWQWWNTNPPR